jgi:hypothetical protein
MSFGAFLLFAVVVVIACGIEAATAFTGELRIYKGADFKRLRRILGVSTSNLCYDMPCASLSEIAASAKWTGLPATGAAFSDGQAKIAFYMGSNCTGVVAMLNTSRGQVDDFGPLGMYRAITSFAVLETSTEMEHPASNVCQWK